MDGAQASAKAPPLALFLLLYAPFGVSSGYVTVTLAFLLGAHGISATAVGALVALSILPQSWKVIWAPIVDATLSARAWYLIGAVATGLTLLALTLLPLTPSAMGWISVLIVASSVASTFTSMSAEVFLAHLEPKLQGRAGGWAQAGNFAGVGLGGSLALVLVERLPPAWISGVVLFVLCVACAAVLPWFHEGAASHRRPNLARTFLAVGRDVWDTSRTRAGLLVIVLMLLPLGSGGAQALLNSTASGEWRVGADLAATVGGLGVGLISIPAALAGGYLCDLMDRRACYCLMGCAVVPILVAAVFMPRTPFWWTVLSLAYGAAIAAAYSAYMGVVIEVIGKGAAATKFNLMASVSNVPITVMPLVDGVFHDKGGSNLMFYGESALSIAAAVLFALLVRATRPAAQAIVQAA